MSIRKRKRIHSRLKNMALKEMASMVTEKRVNYEKLCTEGLPFGGFTTMRSGILAYYFGNLKWLVRVT